MINEIYDTQSLNEINCFIFRRILDKLLISNHWILQPHGSWICDLPSFYRCDHISKPSIKTAYRVISAGSVLSKSALSLQQVTTMLLNFLWKETSGSARVPWGLSKRTLTGRYGNLRIVIAESLFCPPQRHFCDDDGANDVCDKHSSHI